MHPRSIESVSNATVSVPNKVPETFRIKSDASAPATVHQGPANERPPFTRPKTAAATLKPSMKTSLVHTSIIALSSAVSQLLTHDAHAGLVQARLEGVVNASPIAALNGQSWTLTIQFDNAAPETPFTAALPNLA